MPNAPRGHRAALMVLPSLASRSELPRNWIADSPRRSVPRVIGQQRAGNVVVGKKALQRADLSSAAT